MPNPGLRLIASCLCILSLSTPTYADEATSAALHGQASKAQSFQTEFGAEQALNRLDVDGAKSSRIEYQQFKANGTYMANGFTAGLGLNNLQRGEEEYRVPGSVDKRTVSYNPTVGFRAASGLGASLNYTINNTKAVRDHNTERNYDLNTRRLGGQIEYAVGNQLFALRYDGEARAEQDYINPVYQLPLFDRDYVPAQASLLWDRWINPALSVNALMRYSHYNKDVYEEQYGSATPSKPTLGQVFDYLLSFKVGARYSLSQKWAVAGDLMRKAALDVNSYNGDSYVLAYTGGLNLTYLVSKNAFLGVGTEQSKGQKVHEVQQVSYKYANRIERYSGTAAIRF